MFLNLDNVESILTRERVEFISFVILSSVDRLTKTAKTSFDAVFKNVICIVNKHQFKNLLNHLQMILTSVRKLH